MPVPRRHAANKGGANNSAAGNHATGGNGIDGGAQPVVPAGSFDGRWAGLQ